MFEEDNLSTGDALRLVGAFVVVVAGIALVYLVF